MTLFGNQAEDDYQRAVGLVESTIRSLGVDPAQCRVQREHGHAFTLRRGSASILIALTPAKQADDVGVLRLLAPIVHLPADADREKAMMRRLLEANASELSGIAFAVRDTQVVVVGERSVRDLDASEVDQFVRNVGRAADRFDDALAAEFGVERVADRRT